MQTLLKSLHIRLIPALLLAVLATCSASIIDTAAPGGFIEYSTNRTNRPLSGIPFVPSTRSAFNFPAPYNTRGYRITIPSDCNGGSCVNAIGYSYWPRINRHDSNDTMLILVSLQGFGGPTLFSFNKLNEQITKIGPIFPSNDPWSADSAELWYWSASNPNDVYVPRGSSLYRVNVWTRQKTAIFDTNTYLQGTYAWQMHSSYDGLRHSGTLRNSTDYTMLGCFVYFESNSSFFFQPAFFGFDECQIDKSGRYLLIKDDLDNVGGNNAEDNLIIDLDTGFRWNVSDNLGAGGHSDNGFGHYVFADNFGIAGSQKVRNFGAGDLSSDVEIYGSPWSAPGGGPNHVSWVNAKPISEKPLNQQWICGSSSGDGTSVTQQAKDNEVICFKPDATKQVLIVAPVMIVNNGGDYNQFPKGNLDFTGRYFIWSSNMLTQDGRLDVFMVHVPTTVLVPSSGITPAPSTSTPSSTSSPSSASNPSGSSTRPPMSSMGRPSASPASTASSFLLPWSMHFVAVLCFVIQL